MTQRVNIEGRHGTASFVDADFAPVEETRAAYLQIAFDEGGYLILQPDPDSRGGVFVVNAFDPSQPRDEDGKWTDGGGSGGGGGSAGAATGKPKGSKGKGKVKIDDFKKPQIELSETVTRNKDAEKKFLETWDREVGIAPDEFRDKFLGGVNGSMKISHIYIENSLGEKQGTETLGFSGYLKDKDGNNVGEYTRKIDLDTGKATSAYFKITSKLKQGGGIGKKVMAGNISMYEEMGVEVVEVLANIDVGAYAWAKYGYIPDQPSWTGLQRYLSDKIEELSAEPGSDSGGGKTWEELSGREQRHTEGAWRRNTFDEFYDREVENWRDGNDAFEQAQQEIAEAFNEGDKDWVRDTLDELHAARAEEGLKPIPFSNAQLLAAMSVHTDPVTKVEFDDSMLSEPANLPPPEQQTLPGITPAEPSAQLTTEMRESLEKEILSKLEEQAKAMENEVQPPDYLQESARETQELAWEDMFDSDKYALAVQYGIIDDETSRLIASVKPEDRIEPALAAELKTLVSLNDPRALWAIVDSPAGKPLMRDAPSWNGTLDLKEPSTMRRFDAYVGRTKKKDKQLADIVSYGYIRNRDGSEETGQDCDCGSASAGEAEPARARSGRADHGAASGLDGQGSHRGAERSRDVERYWDESKHPREPGGSSAGGQFTGDGGGGGGYSLEAPEAGHKDVAAVHKPTGKKGDRTPVTFHELTAAGAGRYQDSITEAKAASVFGAAVHVYPKGDYQKMRTFLAPDGKSGFALKGDDIVSVFKHPDAKIKDLTGSVLDLAVQQGGKRLDAFDTVLPGIYSNSGFRAVARIPWSDEYAPAGWDKQTFGKFYGGEPDVVFMIHDPENAKPYQPGDGKRVKEYDDGIAAQVEALAGPGTPKLPKTEASKHPGEGYSKEAYVDAKGVIQTNDIADAARALHEDRKVNLDQPRSVSVLLRKLGEVAAEMKKQGKEAKNFNLCNVTISGTNLFCQDNIGLPRVQMPQFTAQQTKDFRKYLAEKGYKVTREEQFAINLRATQNELNGVKVAAIAKNLPHEPAGTIPRLIVSRDDYILDGHHRWAAKIGNDAENNNLTDDAKMRIARIDISITDLLHEAEIFTGGKHKVSAFEKAFRRRA